MKLFLVHVALMTQSYEEVNITETDELNITLQNVLCENSIFSNILNGAVLKKIYSMLYSDWFLREKFSRFSGILAKFAKIYLTKRGNSFIPDNLYWNFFFEFTIRENFSFKIFWFFLTYFINLIFIYSFIYWISFYSCSCFFFFPDQIS